MPRRRVRTPDELSANVTEYSRRYGLYSRSIVTPFESALDWENFRSDIIGAHNPVGAMEFVLAERAAELLWRLRRAALDEQYFIDTSLEHQIKMDERQAHYRATLGDAEGPDSETRQPAIAQTMPVHVALPDHARTSIIRFESHLSRQLMHTLHELEALQQRRGGKPTPLARVDVHGLPGS